MDALFLQIITFLYATVGIISLAAYWPTIKDLLEKKPSANTTSYQIWAFTTGIAFAYSMFVLDDFWLRLISGLNFSICVTIALLSINLRRQSKSAPASFHSKQRKATSSVR